MSEITHDDKVGRLQRLDWELPDADTRYSTHKFHPYSAKYIPQISIHNKTFIKKK